MKKMMLVSAVCFGGLFMNLSVDATELKSLEVSYDLNKRETISYEHVNENGEQIVIEVESVQPVSRVSKGRYKIKKTSKGQWSVVYYVSVNTNNQITKTSGLDIKALKGNIKSTSLTNTKTSATCSLSRKIGTVTSNAKVTAKIINKKLTVS